MGRILQHTTPVCYTTKIINVLVTGGAGFIGSHITENVLLAADEHGVRRVVNASSSSVYDKPDYLPYEQKHHNYPKSPYAVTKLAAEHYCTVWANIYDVPTVNLRYFTVYDPRMRPNMTITNFISRCLQGGPPVIYGDGEQTRDFTYIDDIVEANLTLLDTDAADGENIDVGSTDIISINELAAHVIEETGAPVEPVYDGEREADACHTHADELLDYEPTTLAREGVSRFIEWYRDNEDWYDPRVRSS